MTFHIVMDRPTDFEAASAAAAAEEQPAHAMAKLSERLDAIVHAPAPIAMSRVDDRLRAKLVGSAETWALARRLRARTGQDDTIFCASEHTGFAVAALVGGRRNGPRVAMMVHNIDRPRTRAALRLLNLRQKADLFMSPSQPQIEYLAARGYPPAQRRFVADQTDVAFFSPGPANAKERPLVVSVGLERRDYRTLATAVEMLDLDVKISGFSRDAALLANTFPSAMPSNFNQRFYEWPELVQLYRNADVVVVPVKAGRYAAGVQALLEAMASGRPTVVTASDGLRGYLADEDAITVVPQQDPAAMRDAIKALLSDPEEAARRGRRARDIAVKEYSQTTHVDAIVSALRSLAR